MNQPLAEIEAPWIASDISVNDLENPHWHSAPPVAIARDGQERTHQRSVTLRYGFFGRIKLYASALFAARPNR